MSPDWQVAADLPARLVELREVLGDDASEFTARFGRKRKQFYAWRKARQLPPKGVLEDAAARNGWPIAVFAEGGTMPRKAVNSPVYERKQTRPRESSPPPYGASDAELGALPPDQVLFRLSRELADYLDQGRALSVSRGMWMLEQAFRAGARGAMSVLRASGRGAAIDPAELLEGEEGPPDLPGAGNQSV
jgi:hypothetical protein